jgi:hypothetical protein
VVPRKEGGDWGADLVGGDFGKHIRCWRGVEDGPEAWEEENIFFFFFQILQGISKDFEFSFEFESNHAIQKFKCSSMNAQSCF